MAVVLVYIGLFKAVLGHEREELVQSVPSFGDKQSCNPMELFTVPYPHSFPYLYLLLPLRVISWRTAMTFDFFFSMVDLFPTWLPPT